MKNMRFLIIGNMMSEIDFENLSHVGFFRVYLLFLNAN